MATHGCVLVVDEDPLTRLAVDRQLETLGWDALTVNGGREAIRVIELGIAVHIVLTDLRLPDLDVRNVVATVARLRPTLRLAFMADAPPSEALLPPDTPFLLKPFSTTALANALMRATASRP